MISHDRKIRMEETIYNNFNVYIYIYIFPFFFSIEYYILAFIKKGGKNRGLMAAGSVCLLRNTLIMSLCVTSFFLSLSSLVPWNWCNNAKSSIAYLFFFSTIRRSPCTLDYFWKMVRSIVCICIDKISYRIVLKNYLTTK